MKKIHYLKKKGTISLVAPSFGCTDSPYKERLEFSIDWLKKQGYKIDEGENIWLYKGILRSNTPKKCAEEFMKAYESDSDCIISVGGGETMCETLPYIDFEKLKTLPHKFFMGYSDNTNYTFTLTTICDIPTIYGPMATDFYKCNFRGRNTALDSLGLLTGKSKVIKGYPKWYLPNGEENEAPLEKPKYNKKKELIIVSENKKFSTSGILLGGCLDCLILLCGTSFDHVSEYLEKYKETGFIWFLEACELTSVGIERALFHLKHAGWFKYCKGIVFGRPMLYNQPYAGLEPNKAIAIALKGLKIPYVLDCDFGHLHPSIPIICGVKAKVSVKNHNIYFDYN